MKDEKTKWRRDEGRNVKVGNDKFTDNPTDQCLNDDRIQSELLTLSVFSNGFMTDYEGITAHVQLKQNTFWGKGAFKKKLFSSMEDSLVICRNYRKSKNIL